MDSIGSPSARSAGPAAGSLHTSLQIRHGTLLARKPVVGGRDLIGQQHRLMDSKKDLLEKLTRQGLPLDLEAMARNKKNNGKSRGNESVPEANAEKTEDVEIAPADDVVSTCSPQTAASAAIETAAGDRKSTRLNSSHRT